MTKSVIWGEWRNEWWSNVNGVKGERWWIVTVGWLAKIEVGWLVKRKCYEFDELYRRIGVKGQCSEWQRVSGWLVASKVKRVKSDVGWMMTIAVAWKIEGAMWWWLQGRSVVNSVGVNGKVRWSRDEYKLVNKVLVSWISKCTIPMKRGKGRIARFFCRMIVLYSSPTPARIDNCYT
jgi:hypothetical protein